MKTGKITRQLRAWALACRLKHGVTRTGAAALAGLIAFIPVATRADTLCDTATKAALEAALEEILGKGVPPAVAVSDALLVYLTSPDDKKLDAAMNSFANGMLAIVCPACGAAMTAGQITIGTVDYTIEQAKSLQLDAFMCGGVSLGERLPVDGIFKTDRAQDIAKGVNCDNFADKITTLEQFTKLKSLFKGDYSRSLLQFAEFGGTENVKRYQEVLDKMWAIIEARVGIKMYEKLRADLIREAEALKAKQACPVIPKIVGGDEPLIVNGDARLIWGMEMAGVFTADGAVTGNYASFHFAGNIIEPVPWNGEVTCDGQGTGPAENSGGLFAANCKCEVTIEFESSGMTSTWTADARGLVNYDGHILKSLGKGVRADTGAAGSTFSDMSVELKIYSLAQQ